jgi:hypothetical protein
MENEFHIIREIRVLKKIEYAPVLAGRWGVSWYHLHLPPPLLSPFGDLRRSTSPIFSENGGGREGASVCTVTGAFPALLRQRFSRTPARATALWRDLVNRFTRHRRGVHRLAARLAPNRQVSEQLRGYLSPGGLLSNGMDYTNQSMKVKRNAR